MKKLRYGMVGGGIGSYIGAMHRRAIALDSTAELVAGSFSQRVEKTRELADELGLDPERAYDDYKTMVAGEAAREDGIDFVVVCTPNASHYEICKAFLLAGIAVVCDKPLTIEKADAEELQRIAEEKHLVLAVTYSYTGHVTLRAARALIAAGEIGNIRMVMAEYPLGWLSQEGSGGKQAWRLDPKQSGKSACMADIGTHIENAVHTMTGLKLKRILGKLDKMVPGRQLDDNGVVLCEYDNGASGVYWASVAATGMDNALRIRVYGTKGSIEWAQEDCENLHIIDQNNTRRILRRGSALFPEEVACEARTPAGHPEGYLEALGNLYRNIARAIRQGNDEGCLYPHAADGVEAIDFVDRVVWSSEHGNVWVDMNAPLTE